MGDFSKKKMKSKISIISDISRKKAIIESNNSKI